MSYHNNPTEPKLKLPAGACDAHFHVFGPKDKFPYAKDAPYVPKVDAPKDVLIDRHMFLGIERGVVVQSAAHGYDNSAAADLLAEKKGSYVGVALVPVNVDISELKKLHATLEEKLAQPATNAGSAAAKTAKKRSGGGKRP